MKYGELPEHTKLGVFLYCEECDEKYSATRGDYFHSLDRDAECGACGAPLILATEQRTITPL